MGIVLRSLAAVLLLSLAGLPGAEGGIPPLADPVTVDDPYVQLVQELNPSLLPPEVVRDIRDRNSFVNPASDVTRAATSLSWLTFLIFLPFLVLPQVLLIVVIVKFRDRKDGRKPATFIHNNRLEITWTAIPILALIIVAIPMTIELYKVDTAPDDMERRNPLVVDVVAKQFAWEWGYPDAGVTIDQPDNRLPPLGQESIVFVEDRLVALNFMSKDVNHAWSVPSFGVRKDCFESRINHAWFTPEMVGAFEGQCYELCGAGHGMMLFDAVVTDRHTFERWLDFRRYKLDCDDIVAQFNSGLGDEAEAAAAAFVNAGLDQEARSDALRYWAAFDAVATQIRMYDERQTAENIAAVASASVESRSRFHAMIVKALAAAPRAQRQPATAVEEATR